MVEHQDCAAGLGDLVETFEGDVGVGGHDLGPHERAAPLLDLTPGDLDHTFVLVQVTNRPALDGGSHGQVRVGVDGHGMADRVEHGGVVVTVAVGIAAIEADVVGLCPGRDGIGLFGSPHECPVDLARVLAVDALPLGADDIVESESLGKGPHEGFGRGCCHNEFESSRAVLVEKAARKRLDVAEQFLGSSGRGLLDGSDVPAFGRAHRQFGRHHR